MVTLQDLKLGMKFYVIHSQPNWANRKKHYFIDENNVEWSRYDQPSIDYSFDEYELVGISIPMFVPHYIPSDGQSIIEYYVLKVTDDVDTDAVIWYQDDDLEIFIDLDEVTKEAEKRRKEQKEKDDKR